MSFNKYLVHRKLLDSYNEGYRQSNEFSCGPASAALVASSFNDRKYAEDEWLDEKFKKWVPVDKFLSSRGIGLIELFFITEFILGKTFEVTMHRAYPENELLFKNHLSMMAAGKDLAVICNFPQDHLLERKDSHPSGSPHFSPIAAYSKEENQLLVADVDQDVKEAYWVTTQNMFKCMAEINTVFDLPRGWMTLRKREL